MTLWALVPAKDPRLAKSRLGSILSPQERSELSLVMLKRTIAVLGEVPEVRERVVVSAAEAPLALARTLGCRTLLEEVPQCASADVVARDRPAIERGLNRALQQGAVFAAACTADTVLVMPADLPLLDVAAVQEVLERARHTPGVVIVPDRTHSGTNCLICRPPLALPFSFGRDSFQRHVSLAHARAVPIIVLEHATLALDLDSADDVCALQRMSETDEPARAVVASLLPARYQALDACP